MGAVTIASRIWWRPPFLQVAALGLWMAVAAGVCAQDKPADGDIDTTELQARVRALREADAAVVGIRATAVEDARSIDTLGRRRQGSGVVIDTDGLVLTIGYLILEAEHVDLVIDGERTIPARVVAYDLATGFGLLQALAPVKIGAARFGTSANISTDLISDQPQQHE